MTYLKGIPTEPGLYWYRETLESEAEQAEVRKHRNGYMYVVFIGTGYPVSGYPPSMEDIIANGFYCPAIPPEVNDEY